MLTPVNIEDWRCINGAKAVRGVMVSLQDWVALEEHIPPGISSRALQRLVFLCSSLVPPLLPAAGASAGLQVRSCQ